MATRTVGRSPGLQIALSLVELGWPVFPLTPYQKTPLSGSRGHLDATTDPGRVRALFLSAGDAAGVGVRCAGAAGFAVDCDVKKADGLSNYLTLPVTEWQVPLMVHTPHRPGRHFIYATPDFDVPTGSDVLGPGIDIRGPGGYRVHYMDDGAGSNAYQIDGDLSKLIPAPSEVLELLRLKRESAKRGEGVALEALGDAASGWCPEIQRALDRWAEQGHHREHHDTAALIARLTYLNAEGHVGARAALDTCRGVYALGRQEKSRMDGILREPGEDDYDRMVRGALRRAPSRGSGATDPCTSRPRGL